MSRVLMAGDWHGNYRFAIHVLKLAHLQGIFTIYHLGDFGIWPGDEGRKFLANLSSQLWRQEQTLFFVDGNHEDFPQLYSHPIGEDGFRMVSDEIYHIPRGHRFEVDGKTWMGLGGATSLDRPHRREGISWWPEESLTLGEAYRAATGGPVDVMLTHDCPAGVDIPGLGEYSWPQDELMKAKAHRERVAHVVHDVAPEILFHGHFHRRYDSILRWSDVRPTKIVGLDCDGGMVFDNAVVFDTETLEMEALAL